MSRIHDRPFDAGGTHALDRARKSAPGPGTWATSTRWCFACREQKKLGGGRIVGPGRLWKCGGCVDATRSAA